MSQGSATSGHLTPTERLILDYLAKCEGQPRTKAQIAADLGRNRKTIDRLMAHLRAEGLIVSQPTWNEDGGQLANTYHLGRRP